MISVIQKQTGLIVQQQVTLMIQTLFLETIRDFFAAVHEKSNAR